MVKNDNENFWYPLDNAAKIYPAITTDEITSVFRISARLKQPVNIKRLFRAVRLIESRFPYFKVRLKEGFFWYYFESVSFSASVVPDDQSPCRRFQKGGPLFRILVKTNRISVEFSHLLTDGTGAFEFFKTLLVVYFEQAGVDIPSTFNYLQPNEKPRESEFEDAYNHYFKEDIPASVKRPNAFHLPYPVKSKTAFEVINVLLSIEEVKGKAREKGVNITVYLIAVYLYALQEIYEKSGLYSRRRKYKKLSLEIPINLRNIYPSLTMRNFSLFVMPEIDLRLGHYSFDEITKTVYHQMQLETDEKLVNKILARNVGSERKLLIRSIPLFVKSFLLKMNYYSLGSNQYSGVLSNLGQMDFPMEIKEKIDYLLLYPPPPNRRIKVCCGVIGLGSTIALSFGNISGTKDLEKRFIQFLVEQGIHVKLVT